MKEGSQLCLLTPLLARLDLCPSSSFFWRATLLLAAPPYSKGFFLCFLLFASRKRQLTMLLIVIWKGGLALCLPNHSLPESTARKRKIEIVRLIDEGRNRKS